MAMLRQDNSVSCSHKIRRCQFHKNLSHLTIDINRCHPHIVAVQSVCQDDTVGVVRWSPVDSNGGRADEFILWWWLLGWRCQAKIERVKNIHMLENIDWEFNIRIIMTLFTNPERDRLCPWLSGAHTVDEISIGDNN